MGRKTDPLAAGSRRRRLLVLLLVVFLSCSFAYIAISFSSSPAKTIGTNRIGTEPSSKKDEECCRGVENMELWGSAVKWGADHRLNSSAECCRACKAMCGGSGEPCLCDSWVFCGDRDRCGEKFGECWLKKQKDVLFPALQGSGEKVIWTSGLIFGKGEGIIGLETDYGTLHIKLKPDCAPHSVAYILELLGSRHCAGCQIYRAEGRGHSWDPKGNHIADAPLGPPYALIQGTLEADGVPFKKIPTEACPAIRRGSVAWVGSGPEFFISLANHDEWRRAYTVFGSVLPEDMRIAEMIVSLPTRPDVWSNINVSVLERPVHLRLVHSHTNLKPQRE